MSKPQTDRLIIFDTTLRDGEQSPGCSMNLKEKLRVARELERLGVDVIEAGFPASSPGDFQSVQTIAQELEKPIICGLARCHAGDIERVWEALEKARRKRIHVFVATSAIHREYKLNMAKEQIVNSAVKSVALAKTFCDDIEFSPEDAARTELDFLAEVVEAVIEAGATTVNIPDTVGYTVPGEFAQLFEYLSKHVKNIDKAVLSVHCHNDLGLAVANSLAAVKAGARQVECTINGIGERAGNCSLEEVVMAVKVRDSYFNVRTEIDTTRLYPTSRLVSKITGTPVPRNKAIVGENAFAHEAGIHQHGVLKHSATYEIMRPEDVGFSRTNLVLGKHSGRHAFRERVKELGFTLTDMKLDEVFKEFKKLADRKKEIFDGDIEALVLGLRSGQHDTWIIDELHIAAGTGSIATAAVKLSHRTGEIFKEAAVGDGPIDAAFQAIERATGVTVELLSFDVHSVTIGEDAQGEVTILVSHQGQEYRGSGVSTDIVEAGARALLEVINRIIRTQEVVTASGEAPKPTLASA